MTFHPTALPTLIAIVIILGAAIYIVKKKR
jgi:LPXTG-motif cell wall-anchored protein